MVNARLLLFGYALLCVGLNWFALRKFVLISQGYVADRFRNWFPRLAIASSIVLLPLVLLFRLELLGNVAFDLFLIAYVALAGIASVLGRAIPPPPGHYPGLIIFRGNTTTAEEGAKTGMERGRQMFDAGLGTASVILELLLCAVTPLFLWLLVLEWNYRMGRNGGGIGLGKASPAPARKRKKTSWSDVVKGE
jgi:hypothetical protein